MHGTQPRTQMRTSGCKYYNLLLLLCAASSPVQLPEEIVPSDSCRVHTATIQKLKMALKEQQKNHETELKKQSMKHMVAMQKCERKNRFPKNRFSRVQVTLHSPACMLHARYAHAWPSASSLFVRIADALLSCRCLWAKQPPRPSANTICIIILECLTCVCLLLTFCACLLTKSQ